MPSPSSCSRRRFPCEATRRAVARKLETANAIIAANDFRRHRPLASYLRMFGTELQQLLAWLRNNDHVMDAGSGETVAMAEYLAIQRPKVADDLVDKLFEFRLGTANVTAVAFTMSSNRERLLRDHPKLNLRTRQYFEKLEPRDLIGRFGRVAAIIDYWGVLAYTAFPSESLRLMMASLKPGGKIFLAVGPRKFDSVSASGRLRRESSAYRSTVWLRDGDTITFPDWLRRIPGLLIREYGAALIIEVPDPSAVIVPDCYLEDIDDTVPNPPARRFVEGRR